MSALQMKAHENPAEGPPTMRDLTDTPAPHSLGDRVEWLFRNRTGPEGTPYSLREVEEGTARLGHRLSASSLRKIRQGQTRNPGYRTVVVLARFFGVPVTWLIADAVGEEGLRCQRLYPGNGGTAGSHLFATPEVEQIARRVRRFEPEVQRAVLALVDCL